MRIRPALLAGVVALLSLASPASAVTTLDGARRTQHVYTGRLVEAVVVAARMKFGDPVQRTTHPRPADCEQSSCNVLELVLELPPDRDTGTLKFSVVTQPLGGLAPPGYADPVAYGVYDANDKEYGYWAPGQNPPNPTRPRHLVENPRPVTAAEPVFVARLPRGRYTLVVFNLGGPVSFTGTVSWSPNRPSRPTP